VRSHACTQGPNGSPALPGPLNGLKDALAYNGRRAIDLQLQFEPVGLGKTIKIARFT